MRLFKESREEAAKDTLQRYIATHPKFQNKDVFTVLIHIGNSHYVRWHVTNRWYKKT